MPRPERAAAPSPPPDRQRRRLLQAGALALGGVGASGPLRAAGEGRLEFSSFELQRPDDGLLLSYGLHLVLPDPVEDALLKGVPLHFVVEVEVDRERWYWRDRRVARQRREWRLAWQPLTRRYRLSLGGFNQQHERLEEALGVIAAASRWQVAEAGSLDPEATHSVLFSFRLDSSRLPRPLQFSAGTANAWNLVLERQATLLPRRVGPG